MMIFMSRDWEYRSAFGEVAPFGLLILDGNEKTLEVTCAEALMVLPLDDLEEEGWAVLDWLCEDLEEVALVIVVDEDLVLLDLVDVFRDFDVHVGEVLAEVVVVGVGDVEELDAPLPEVLDSLNDGLGLEGDVLDAGAMVVVDVLLDLGLPLAQGGFVDGHLHVLIVVGDHDGAQGGVLGVEGFVVDGPELVPPQALLVELHGLLHLQVGLVPHNVVHLLEPYGVQDLVQGLLEVMCLEPWQEQTLVLLPLHERVRRVPVGLHRRHDHEPVLVLQPGRCRDGHRPILDCIIVQGSGVFDLEGHIPHPITVLDQVLIHGLIGVVVVD